MLNAPATQANNEDDNEDDNDDDDDDDDDNDDGGDGDDKCHDNDNNHILKKYFIIKFKLHEPPRHSHLQLADS